MQDLLLYVLAGALAAYLIYQFIVSLVQNRRYAAQAERLGCKPAPLLRNQLPFGVEHLHSSLKADETKQFPEFIAERYAKMGNRTHEYNLIGNNGFLTADPKNIQAILATQFKDFGLGRIRRSVFMPLLGNGIFTNDGPAWEHSRAMMRPQFAREQVSDLELEEAHVQNLMRALPVDSQSKWTPSVDLQVLFFRLTLDSACEFLFGESVDSQLINLPENAGVDSLGKGPRSVSEIAFAKAFDSGQAWLAFRSRFMDKYWIADGLSFRQHSKTVHTFIDHFVHLALNKDLQEKELEKGASVAKKDRYVFLDALVAQTRDPLELRSQLLHILLAGRDTTASLLGRSFWLLARHPAIFAKLRSIILEDFGTYSTTSSSSASSSTKDRISFASLKNCTYMQHFLAEVLRLYPVVPMNSRRSTCATTLPRGGGPDGSSPIFIKPEQSVDYSVHVMHRLKELWGEDAEEFRPERWVGRRPGWEYLPFNGGPRICIGREFLPTQFPTKLFSLSSTFPTSHRMPKTYIFQSYDTDLRQYLQLADCVQQSNSPSRKLLTSSSGSCSASTPSRIWTTAKRLRITSR